MADRTDDPGLPLAKPGTELELVLKDGGRVIVRAIRPGDGELLQQGLSQLSEKSRYLRFHTVVNRLSNAQLDYLVNVDHHDHEALLALDPDNPDSPGLGVARYIRLTDEPEVAEAAVTVIDEHQGRGIGSALIGLLEPLARSRGIHTFRNYVLSENRAMLGIFSQLDGQFESEGSGLYRVDIPIPEDAAEQPDTPVGQWLTEVGRATPKSDGPTWAYPVLWMADRVADVVVDTVKTPSRVFKRLMRELDSDDERETPPDEEE